MCWIKIRYIEIPFISISMVSRRFLSGDSIVFLCEYVLTWYIHLLAWTRYIVLESKHNNMLLWYAE